MTTADIESLANRGRIVGADFQLGKMLRKYVIPQFLLKVGDVRWRHIFATATFAPPTRTFALPTDFFKMIAVYPNGSTFYNGTWNRLPLQYIGGDSVLLAQSEVATTAGSPSGYYIVRASTTAAWKTLKLNCPTSEALSLPYEYYSAPTFTDDTTDTDLDPFVPELLQAGLIAGLRKEIMRDRYGLKDPRYVAENGEYLDWIEQAKNHVDLGPQNFASYVT